MRVRDFVLALLLCPTLACLGCRDRDPARTARPAAVGLDQAGRLRPGPTDRCPVCAMSPAEHGRFASAVETTDGRTFYFCAPGCMIRSWLHPEVYLGLGRGELRRAVVQDYLTGEAVDGSAVTFVVGSDVVGPMGPAMVPVSGAGLEAFRGRHGGGQTFRLGELDDERFEALTGRRAVPAATGARPGS